mgnify:CR=1 FL=1
MILLVSDMNGRVPEKTEGWNIYMKKMEDYVRSIPDFPEPGCDQRIAGCRRITYGDRQDAGTARGYGV